MADFEQEEWRQIEGFPKYEISSLGRLRNIKTGKIRIQRTHPHGYKTITLSKGGKEYCKRIHRFVAFAFLGTPVKGCEEVNHKNGIKADNRAENLEWCTRLDNMRHAQNAGLISPTDSRSFHQRGGYKKLTLLQVKEIKSLRMSGLTLQQLASLYGVGRSTIHNVVTGKSWNKEE